jgi:shikimate dehydrogenase
MRLFGLIGKPLSHSFSQKFFTDKFKNEGLSECRYQNFELAEINDLPRVVKAHKDLVGLNVTIPYKQAVLSFLDSQDLAVNKIGACNCIKVSQGKLTGFNTDVIGFKNSLQPLLQLHHTKALVLGTGGASKAVQYTLKELGIDYLAVSRNVSGSEINYEAVTREIIDNHFLIINTTPLGMYPNTNDSPQLPYEFIGPKHFLYDLIYNPVKTKFLNEGQRRGAKICNGYEMLQQQALESWNIWNGTSSPQ